MITKKSKRTRKPSIAHLEARITKEELLAIRSTGYDNLADWIENRFKSDNRINLEEVAARPLPVVETPVVEAPAIETPVIADSEIPAEIPAHLKVEQFASGSWSFWCPVCQEGATASAFVVGGLIEHHAHCKSSKRKRKQAVLSSENQEPVAVTSEPVKAEAPAPAARLLLVKLPPPIRPDMIRKPVPPSPPSDFEWILPPAPKAAVRSGLFSRVWIALKKIA